MYTVHLIYTAAREAKGRGGINSGQRAPHLPYWVYMYFWTKDIFSVRISYVREA